MLLALSVAQATASTTQSSTRSSSLKRQNKLCNICTAAATLARSSSIPKVCRLRNQAIQASAPSFRSLATPLSRACTRQANGGGMTKVIKVNHFSTSSDGNSETPSGRDMSSAQTKVAMFRKRMGSARYAPGQRLVGETCVRHCSQAQPACNSPPSISKDAHLVLSSELALLSQEPLRLHLHWLRVDLLIAAHRLQVGPDERTFRDAHAIVLVVL